MRKSLLVAMMSMCVGCGGIDSQEEAMAAGLDLQEEMVEILEGVTDKGSAEDAAEEFKDLIERGQELGKKMAELPAASAEEIRQFMDDNKGRMEDIQKRMMAVFQRISKYPELEQAMQKAMAGVK